MKQKNSPWLRKNNINLLTLRNNLQQQLRDHHIENPAQTSLILLSHALNRSKSWILAHGENLPSPSESALILDAQEKLLEGRPLPYIIGSWAFYGRSFIVTPDVLIPRPETELLVETAITYLQHNINPAIVDVGTGSGAIAISLALENPSWCVTAVDISKPALSIARQNAIQHTVQNISLVQGDLLSPFKRSFDMICANLPYIPTRTLRHLSVAQWEPSLALDGGETGFRTIDRMLEQAATRLSPQGVILIEIESSLGTEALAHAKKAFPEANILLLKDLAGHDRLITIQIP